MSGEEARRETERLEQKLEEIPYGRMLRCRVRYFTDGAVIGSRARVNLYNREGLAAAAFRTDGKDRQAF